MGISRRNTHWVALAPQSNKGTQGTKWVYLRYNSENVQITKEAEPLRQGGGGSMVLTHFIPRIEIAGDIEVDMSAPVMARLLAWIGGKLHKYVGQAGTDATAFDILAADSTQSWLSLRTNYFETYMKKIWDGKLASLEISGEHGGIITGTISLMACHGELDDSDESLDHYTESVCDTEADTFYFTDSTVEIGAAIQDMWTSFALRFNRNSEALYAGNTPFARTIFPKDFDIDGEIVLYFENANFYRQFLTGTTTGKTISETSHETEVKFTFHDNQGNYVKITIPKSVFNSAPIEISKESDPIELTIGWYATGDKTNPDTPKFKIHTELNTPAVNQTHME